MGRRAAKVRSPPLRTRTRLFSMDLEGPLRGVGRSWNKVAIYDAMGCPAGIRVCRDPERGLALHLEERRRGVLPPPNGE